MGTFRKLHSGTQPSDGVKINRLAAGIVVRTCALFAPVLMAQDLQAYGGGLCGDRPLISRSFPRFYRPSRLVNDPAGSWQRTIALRTYEVQHRVGALVVAADGALWGHALF